MFCSHAYVHKPRETLQGNFNSCALSGTPVGYCQGSAYRAIVNDEKIIVEWRDVKIVEGIGPIMASPHNDDVIEFELKDKNAIFDDIIHRADSSTEENEEVLTIFEIIYGRTESEPQTELNFDEQTYYPSIWRHKQWTPGSVPDRLINDEVNILTELKEKSKV